MKHLLLLLSLYIILFEGCSTKEPHVTVHSSHVDSEAKEMTHLNKESNEDDFEDEYEKEDSNAEEPLDLLSGYNRMMTSFNDIMFTYALNPISKGYSFITPEFIRQSIANVIHNIQFPIRFTNNILQGKFQNSSDEFERFIVNTTIGLGGLLDPASTYMHIPAHNEDFGQTLGYYGVGSGFHIVLPFLGPSNVRDSLGLIADGYLSPLIYQKGLARYKLPRNYGQSVGIYGLDVINKNSLHLGAYESLKKDALDLYPFLRDFYEEKRKTDITE